MLDGTVWSEEISISNTGENVKSFGGILQDNGELFVAFNRTEKLPDEDYFIDGQADLCVTTIVPSYDISVSYPTYFQEDLIPKSELPIDVVVKNEGELPIQSITIVVKNEDGSINSSENYLVDLLPGQSTEVRVQYVAPDTITFQTLTISAEPIGEIDCNLADNIVEVEVGFSDIGIENIEFDGSGVLKARINNYGYVDVVDTKAQLRYYAPDGEIIDEQNIGTIPSSDTNEIEFAVDKDELQKLGEDVLIYLTVTTESNEHNIGNNYDYVIYLIEDKIDLLPKFRCGDVNGDRVVNTKDVIAFLRYSVGLSTDYIVENAYINDDNVIDNRDATYLLRALAYCPTEKAKIFPE